jgi:NADPH2:quinone reductase
MKAAFIEKTGGLKVIQFGDLPKPHPGPGEVLVRVRAASINPIDIYIRAGAVSMNLPKPYIPGCDLAGVVEAVGGSGPFQAGNRVWGSNQGLLGRQGTLAEYACVAENWLYPTPASVSDEQAAAAALTGITGHLGLFGRAHLQAGETLFVNGGTGGVGSMVVQMARAVGAYAIATVGSAEKVAKCRELGADVVLNYKTDDVDKGIIDFTKGKGVDVWFETQREPDLERIVKLVRQRGRIVLIAGRQARPTFPVGPFYVKDLSLFGFAMFNATAEEQRRAAEDINRWLEEKKLKVEIGKTFPLSEAALAHRLLEENTLHKAGTLSGKIIVVL